MGLLVDGVWQEQPHNERTTSGRFERPATRFRNWVTEDGSRGPSGEDGFAAARGRYHLYVALACPWAHRTVIFRTLKGLEEVVPRPGHKATGEERAWGRRLAKRFGAEGRIDDRTFVLAGDGSPGGVLDYEALKPEAVEPAVAALFDALDRDRCDSLVAFGWAMAEDLAARNPDR